jgi:hypothetical protein
MTRKSKRAPVNQNPIADRVIPNPFSVYGCSPTKMQIFYHQSAFHYE